jgi:hypothetical protein
MLRKIALVIGGLVLAFALEFSISGWWFHMIGKTPGMIASDILIHPVFGNEREMYAAVGDRAFVQLAVDWLFWFVVVCLIYFLVRRFVRTKRRL